MSPKTKKWVLSGSLLVIIFAFGLIFGLNSWNKNLYVSWTPTANRGIATEDSQKNLLHLSYEDITKQVSSVLFSKNQVFQEEGFLSFYLANLLIPDANTQKHRFICEVFPLVEFSFSALGVSLSGERGLMVIQSPCNMKDTDWIGPFWIPQEEILSNPEKSAFQIQEKDTFIRFYNASIELTPSWLLSTVRFFDEEESQEFLIRLKPNQTPYFNLELLNDTVE